MTALVWGQFEPAVSRHYLGNQSPNIDNCPKSGDLQVSAVL